MRSHTLTRGSTSSDSRLRLAAPCAAGRRWRFRAGLGGLVLASLVGVLALLAPSGASARTLPASGALLGVYKGAGAPGAVDSFAAWLGRKPTYAVDFLAYADWDEISSPTWWLERWQGSGYTMIYSVAMIPDDGEATLAEGADGAYDEHWEALARNLVAYGQADSVIRLGWEFNGDWFPWSAYKNPSAFVRYWRAIVAAMRSVPGADFRFEWSPVMGTSAIDPELVYPGDAYVDYIGLSVFDQSFYSGYQVAAQRWNHILSYPFGLQWHRDFAALHGKPLTYPEWGLIERPDGHGGGDNPFFLERMYDWLAANRHAIAFQAYFDPNPRSLTANHYPSSAVRFRQLFSTDFPAVSPPTVQQPVQSVSGSVAVRVHGGPTVRIKRPRDRVKLRKRRVVVRAQATAPKGLRRVTFRIGARTKCFDRKAPFRCKIRKLKRGKAYQIVVTVTDKAGWTASSSVRVKVRKRARV